MKGGSKSFVAILSLALLFSACEFVRAETTDVTVSVVEPQCSDGLDNDSDLAIDYPLDTGCIDEYDDQEEDDPDPECSDGIDNDLDSRIDFPADLGCDSTSDNTEVGEITTDNTIQTTQTPGVPVSKDFDNNQTEVRFVGFAYPNSAISLMKDGREIARSETDARGGFSIKKGGFKSVIHSLTLVAIDENGRYSAPLSFTVFLNPKAITEVRDVFMPPTFSLSHGIAKQGTRVLLRGMAQVSNEVVIDNDNFFTTSIIADDDGNYNFSIDTSDLSKGEYVYVAKIKNKIGQFIKSSPLRLVVGDKDVENKKEFEICVPKADLNLDCKVNIVDFSIAAFWWESVLSERLSQVEKNMLNNDGIIDIRDFSILAFYWTG